MPRKIRELIKEIEAAGFIDRGGKGSHRNFVHPNVGKPGDDVKYFQEKAVLTAIEESKNER